MKKNLFIILPFIILLIFSCGGDFPSTILPTETAVQTVNAPAIITGTIFFNNSSSQAPYYSPDKANTPAMSKLIPLANAVVSVIGTDKMTATDNEGYYSITVDTGEIGTRTLRIVKDNIDLTFQLAVESKKSYMTAIRISENSGVYSLSVEKEEGRYTEQNTVNLLSEKYFFEYTSVNPANWWIFKTDTNDTIVSRILNLTDTENYKMKLFGEKEDAFSVVYSCTDNLTFYGLSDSQYLFYKFDTSVIFSHYNNMKLGKIYNSELSVLSGLVKLRFQEIFLGFDTVTTNIGLFNNCVKIKTISDDGSYDYDWYYKGIGNIKTTTYDTGGNFEDSKVLTDYDTEPFGLTLPKPKKKWTVMLYACTDNPNNDLTPQVLRNEIMSLKNIGSDTNVNFIVQIDMAKDTESLLSGIIEENSTYRLYFDEDNYYYLKNFGELNSGDPVKLINYVNYCHSNFPSDSYILILIGHGSGSVSYPYPSNAPSRVIGYDDTQKDFLSYNDLHYAFNQIKYSIGNKLDLLILNSCKMSNIEVAYEISDYVNYIIASEKTTYGFQYSALENLKTNPDMSVINISKNIIDSTYDYYNNNSQFKELTIALINAGVIDNTFIQTFKDYTGLFINASNFWPNITYNMIVHTEPDQPEPQIDLFALLETSQNILGYYNISNKAESLYSYRDLLIPYFKKTADLSNYDYRGISIFYKRYESDLEAYINSGSQFNENMSWSTAANRFYY